LSGKLRNLAVNNRLVDFGFKASFRTEDSTFPVYSAKVSCSLTGRWHPTGTTFSRDTGATPRRRQSPQMPALLSVPALPLASSPLTAALWQMQHRSDRPLDSGFGGSGDPLAKTRHPELIGRSPKRALELSAARLAQGAARLRAHGGPDGRIRARLRASFSVEPSGRPFPDFRTAGMAPISLFLRFRRDRVRRGAHSGAWRAVAQRRRTDPTRSPRFSFSAEGAGDFGARRTHSVAAASRRTRAFGGGC
jgi:hypothetical protein